MRVHYAVLGKGQFVYDSETGEDVQLSKDLPPITADSEEDVVPDGPDPTDADH